MLDYAVLTGRDRAGRTGPDAAEWTVPGYTELKRLGSGGFGHVVLARHEGTGTRVAIKYLRRDLLADPQWAQLFRAEARLLATLDDPNIVRLYEYAESPSGAGIVMELVDGVSVRQILALQGATTPEAALVVLRGSLLGLAAAHRRGIVHRDYKPENVLVDGNGRSKLADFGIAAQAGAEPLAAGSLVYAPPEQFAGQPASPAGDVYAATATFYECLTGRPPFTGGSAERLLYQHLNEPVPLDPVPEPLRPLIAAGMAKEPKDRPANAANFVSILNAIAARAYGPDWADHGRSHLAEAALLLALLWPSGGPVVAAGPAVEQIRLVPKTPEAPKSPAALEAPGAPDGAKAREARHLRHWWHVRHLRHLGHLRSRRSGERRRFGLVKMAAAVAVVAVGAAGGAAVAMHLTGQVRPGPVALPAITGVAPGSGTEAGGTAVTITGTGLADATGVSFGGAASRITADSPTQITVLSPPSTGVGVAVITVTTRAGTSKLTAASHYAYTASHPAVTGVGRTTVSTAGTGQPQSVTFTSPAPGTVGGSASLSATASSGLPVVFTVGNLSAGTCTVAGGTVTYTAAGSCIIDATQAGNASFAAAPQAEQTIIVSGEPQSIAFAALAPGTVGGSASLAATASSGLPVVFTAASAGVCTVSGRTVSYVAAGSCVIDASQVGNATYAAAVQAQQTIAVSGKPQSITFTAPAPGTVGGSASLSATASSGLPVVFTVANPGAGTCTVAGSTVSYTAAGSCVIDAGQAGDASYAAAAAVQQTITVGKASKQS